MPNCPLSKFFHSSEDVCRYTYINRVDSAPSAQVRGWGWGLGRNSFVYGYRGSYLAHTFTDRLAVYTVPHKSSVFGIHIKTTPHPDMAGVSRQLYGYPQERGVRHASSPLPATPTGMHLRKGQFICITPSVASTVCFDRNSIIKCPPVLYLMYP